jgi:nucleotide-binding universal stress UspA family protein
VIATGAAHDAIIRIAATMSADLIVMGTYRRQLLRDIIVGTTIERVIRTGSWPVLMANNETHPYANVMAAVDQSAASADAVRAAVTLGLLANARVTVVHAFDAIAKSKLYLADVPKDHIEAYVEEERKRSVAELQDFMTSLSAPAKSWTPYVVEGEAMPVILQAVETIRPELLVVGTHGRSGVAKVLLGSVAEQVLRTIRIDILAVPTSPPHA